MAQQVVVGDVQHGVRLLRREAREERGQKRRDRRSPALSGNVEASGRDLPQGGSDLAGRPGAEGGHDEQQPQQGGVLRVGTSLGDARRRSPAQSGLHRGLLVGLRAGPHQSERHPGRPGVGVGGQ